MLYQIPYVTGFCKAGHCIALVGRGYQGYCKACQTKKRRKDSIERNSNISVEQFDYLYSKQNGCCAICGKHQIVFKKRLAVDHCHKTGKIRGLLCTTCNSQIIVVIEHYSHLIQKAQTYLKETL